MLLHHNTLSAVLLIILTATYHAAGVQIDSVGLKTGLPYVKRWDPAHIMFNLTMGPEEALQRVVWQKDDGDSRYEWHANGTVIVSGIFEETTDVNASNGELLFPHALRNHAGDYSLTILTSNGTDNATYNLIVFEHFYYSFSDPFASPENCTWPVKLVAYQFAPYPNISCVFEDVIGGAPSVPLDEIAEVEPNITRREDGTFDYELAPNISILRVPMDSLVSCQLWIEGIGVPLIKVKPTEIAKPCPEPHTRENMTYTFMGWPYKSCYDGYYQGTVVSYFCIFNPNVLANKTLQCRSDGRWIETDTTPWPKCNTPPEPTSTEPTSTETTSTEPTSTETTSTETTSTEPTSTEAMSTDNSGSSLTFHRILLTATFLIASYCVMM